LAEGARPKAQASVVLTRLTCQEPCGGKTWARGGRREGYAGWGHEFSNESTRKQEIPKTAGRKVYLYSSPSTRLLETCKARRGGTEATDQPESRNNTKEGGREKKCSS